MRMKICPFLDRNCYEEDCAVWVWTITTETKLGRGDGTRFPSYKPPDDEHKWMHKGSGIFIRNLPRVEWRGRCGNIK